MDEYLAFRNKDIGDLIRDAPEELIIQRYRAVRKRIHFDDAEMGKEPSVNQMREVLFAFERASGQDNRGSFLPPLKNGDFSWSEIRELMKYSGAEMVARNAVTELIFILAKKVRDWTQTALSMAQGKEISAVIMQKAITQTPNKPLATPLNPPPQPNPVLLSPDEKLSINATTPQDIKLTPAQSSGSSNAEVAVFWDYENVCAATQGVKLPLAESILEQAKAIGHVRVKKVYANWRSVSTPVTLINIAVT